MHGQNLGKENPCPIEYRNIFIKELTPGDVPVPAKPPKTPPKPASPNAELLARIDRNALPKAYNPARHQEYVDRRMAGLRNAQKGRVGRLWKEKQRIDPHMPNRGQSFVKIMEHVAEDGQGAAEDAKMSKGIVLLPFTVDGVKREQRI